MITQDQRANQRRKLEEVQSRDKWLLFTNHRKGEFDKARPDFLYQLCRETAIRVSTGARKPRRGNMRFLPPLEMYRNFKKSL